MHRKLLLGVVGIAVAIGLVFPVPSAAQLQGYVVGAPGGTSPGTGTTMYLGGGVEGFAKKGFAISGDLGYLAPAKSMRSGFGLIDLDGGYHFARDRKVSPFVSAGYSLGFRSGHFNAVNFGGGANVWLSSKLGLRLELRDVFHPETGANVHFVNMRIGLTFR